MMGSTHMAVGAAVSLAVLQPSDLSGTACAIAGGVLGGLASDIDVRGSKGGREVRRNLIVLAVVLILGVASDCFTGRQIYDYMVLHFGAPMVVSGIALLVLCVVGVLSAHRSFTHSLCGWVLFSVAMVVFCEPIGYPFALGYGSHLALDVLNKKGIQLLWPLDRRFCLGLCGTGGITNGIIMMIALAASVSLLGYRLAAVAM